MTIKTDASADILLFNVTLINFCIVIILIHKPYPACSSVKLEEPGVKTLRFPLSVQFSRHCVLSDETLRRSVEYRHSIQCFVTRARQGRQCIP